MGTTYDESGFERVLRWDPRFAIPGGLIALISIPIWFVCWPDLLPGIALLAIGGVLLATGLAARLRLRVEPGQYTIAWELGFLRRQRRIPADGSTKVRYRSAKRGWAVLICRGWRSHETFIYTDTEAHAQHWATFLEEVAAGKHPAPPDDTSTPREAPPSTALLYCHRA